MPTGAGKTVTAQAIAADEPDPLWLVHTTALRDQAPGVAVTVQSLLSGYRPKCSLLIADECHHLGGQAEAWRAVAEHYPRILGLTATPCRHDGAPLDLFGTLVVGAAAGGRARGVWAGRGAGESVATVGRRP
jgi:superfamily II DNA or RNA helicase